MVLVRKLFFAVMSGKFHSLKNVSSGAVLFHSDDKMFFYFLCDQHHSISHLVFFYAFTSSYPSVTVAPSASFLLLNILSAMVTLKRKWLNIIIGLKGRRYRKTYM